MKNKMININNLQQNPPKKIIPKVKNKNRK